MKRFLYMICLCLTTLGAQAQKLTRDYRNQSLSTVLEDLNKAAAGKTLYFIYDELEDFTVSCHFSDLTLEDALREVIGFYPIKVTWTTADKVFVECTQKEDVRVIGRVVDEKGQPIEFANITLLSDTVTTAADTFLIHQRWREQREWRLRHSLQTALAGNGRGEGGTVTVKVSYVGYKTVSRR